MIREKRAAGWRFLTCLEHRFGTGSGARQVSSLQAVQDPHHQREQSKTRKDGNGTPVHGRFMLDSFSPSWHDKTLTTLYG